MYKFIIILIAAILLQACSSDPDKYELKSPCVANDSADVQAAPCQRRPANKWLG